MADIDVVQKKGGMGWMVWVLLAVVAVIAVWLFTRDGDTARTVSYPVPVVSELPAPERV